MDKVTIIISGVIFAAAAALVITNNSVRTEHSTLPLSEAEAIETAALETAAIDSDQSKAFSIAGEDQNPVFMRDILLSAYEAKLAIHNGRYENASKHIDSAGRQLEHIEPAAQATAKMKDIPLYDGRRALSISYGKEGQAPVTSIIPLGKKPLSLDELGQHVDLTGIKPGDITTAHVRYIAYDMNKEQIRSLLDDTVNKMAEEQYQAARFNLERLQQDMLVNDASEVEPYTRARDHILLARFLIKRTEYQGARQALKEAKAAMDNVPAEHQHEKWKKPEMQALQSTIESMSSLLSKRDPTLLDELDSTLSNWWEKLS